MSLTAVHGPLSREPAGRLNFELDAPSVTIYLDPMPYRIRAVFEDETVVDAFEPYLVHETGKLPVFYFSRDDVRTDLFELSGTDEEDGKGVAEQWTLRVGDRSVPGAAWTFTRPSAEAELLEDLVALDWDAMDEWFCEDEQIYGHPRDPFSRIDVYRTSRHVRVSLDGEPLAETRRAAALYETGLPPRYYIPAEDVRAELLVPSSSRTRCAYKGSASYWSVQIGDRLVEDLVWTYRDPELDAEPVRDLLCFFNERVDLEIEGEPVERPRTQFSREDEAGGDGAQSLRGVTAARASGSSTD